MAHHTHSVMSVWPTTHTQVCQYGFHTDSVMPLRFTTQTQRCQYCSPHILGDVTSDHQTDSEISVWLPTHTL
ncbi:hypothetical protein DPMN_001703 [Dreissena polymorpha]|uniref:Uncharacterized protein n=1 Tax=Dreissena polymorpha TaxID=45954 RepID=A0A9D4MKJ4_DREPO|nr:hypothetical protein DPMN_001703 [Dreissena polymorpha]